MLFRSTAFLDAKARSRLREVLSALPQAKLIATHDATFAQEVCGRTLLLEEGRLWEEELS